MKDQYPIPEVWVNPGRRGGKPCVVGSRIPVETIARLQHGGMSSADVVRFYPSLVENDVRIATDWYHQGR